MTMTEANLLARLNERAERLFEDGYRAEQIDEYTVEIVSPDGETYEIDTLFETCTCPFFMRWKGQNPCKHLLGWHKLLVKQEAVQTRIRKT